MSATISQIINRTCINKVSLSKKDADDIIDKYASQGRLLYYYKCVFCNRYHISKKSYTKYNVVIIGGNK